MNCLLLITISSRAVYILVRLPFALNKLERTALDRGLIDRISLTHDLNLDLGYDLELQSSASYGHDLLTCKSSRSTVSRFRR